MKIASLVAVLSFAVAVILSPKSESRFEMSWPMFLCTWGVTLAAVSFTLTTYFVCRAKGIPVSRRYAVYSGLLLAGFLTVLNYGGIIRFLSGK